MLTRFEVSGFKNFRDVVVDLGPFTCIAGPNAVGKSNLFDAISLLSALSRYTFMEACAQVRTVEGRWASEVSVLLSQAVISGRDNLRLAAEMIVPEVVVDEFGQEARPSKTYLRYEVELAYVDSMGQGGLPALRLAHEELRPLAKHHQEDGLFSKYPALKNSVRGQRKKAYMSPVKDSEGDVVAVDVPRETQGRPRRISTERSQRTVLSAMASAEYPTLLAAKDEMSSWRFVALEPTAMRAPDDRMEIRSIDATGAHIPATLHRRAMADANRSVFTELVHDIEELVDIRKLGVAEDEARQALVLRAQVGDAPDLPARSLSDGTLRFLALAAMNYAGVYVGLVSMEEPENGIHPAKIGAMLNLLRSLAEPRDGRLRQVIINTHSPYLVQEIQRRCPEDILVAQSWRRRERGGERMSSTSFHPLPDTWRAQQWEKLKDRPRSQVPVSVSKLYAFLENPAMGVEGIDD
ncbi:AAA family ATPase [Actinomyces bowdenii]|uniref:AAA family ATPase n=1 Tax=Actinomyces bowdenii TaxID=131109 RepID=A0A853EI04_9ACTO|nr:ATP-binding protein [Actinomyces bowdenii]MBF0696814.1 AAA family ATPase [Actinomyces bowdenii]NYS68987.1 AAA family ATPase [Actinomyces bowdenii]